MIILIKLLLNILFEILKTKNDEREEKKIFKKNNICKLF
jgi:hypothetical protein